MVKHTTLSDIEMRSKIDIQATKQYDIKTLEFEGSQICATANTILPVLSHIGELALTFHKEQENRDLEEYFMFDDSDMEDGSVFDEEEDFMMYGSDMEEFEDYHQSKKFISLVKQSKKNKTTKKDPVSLNMASTAADTLHVYDDKISNEKGIYFSVEQLVAAAKKKSIIIYYKWKPDNPLKLVKKNKKVADFAFQINSIKTLVLSDAKESSHRLQLSFYILSL